MIFSVSLLLEIVDLLLSLILELLIVAHLVLEHVADDVEDKEAHEIAVEGGRKAEIACLESLEGLGLVGVTTNEEAKATNDEVRSNDVSDVYLGVLLVLVHAESTTGRGKDNSDPEQDGRGSNELCEDEGVDEEPDEEATDCTDEATCDLGHELSQNTDTDSDSQGNKGTEDGLEDTHTTCLLISLED